MDNILQIFRRRNPNGIDHNFNLVRGIILHDLFDVPQEENVREPVPVFNLEDMDARDVKLN